MNTTEKIEKLISEELADANRKHELFHSPHEAFAVTLEEVEEVQKEVKYMDTQIRKIWVHITHDVEQEELYEDLKKYAIFTIQEAIQVAAMAEKAIQSLYND